MDKMTRIRLKTLMSQLEAALATCERLDKGTDPDGRYIAEQVADKVEDQLMEIGMMLADE